MKPNGATWRHARARLDLSAEDAAVRLRISPGYLKNIESNQSYATPSVRLVYRAVELYGVAYEDLVAKDDDPQAPPEQDPPQRDERDPDPSGPPSRPDRDRKGPPRSDLKAAS